MSASEQVDDMAFYSNNLLISVGGLGKVFGFDTTDTVIEVSEYFDASFNKGLYVNGNILFLTAANSVVTKQLDIASPTISTVALNTIYQDSNNGIPFLANFRDVVLIGDKIYMTLLNQGRVVTVQNESFLNTNSFDLSKISIHNSQSEVIIFGLEDNQKAELYNLSGQLLTTKNVSSNDNLIDISSFSKGVYIIKLENQKIFKFIK